MVCDNTPRTVNKYRKKNGFTCVPVSVLFPDELDALIGVLFPEALVQQVRLDAHVTHHHHHLITARSAKNTRRNNTEKKHKLKPYK